MIEEIKTLMQTENKENNVSISRNVSIKLDHRADDFLVDYAIKYLKFRKWQVDSAMHLLKGKDF